MALRKCDGCGDMIDESEGVWNERGEFVCIDCDECDSESDWEYDE